MRHPTVTIAVTVHNRERYIAQCLDSILAQTLRDIEVVCVDDASTDGSFSILERYAALDNRIRLHRFTENRGVQQARNHATKAAQGEYIIFVDDDDWISDDCAEQCVKCFLQTPEADCVLIPELRQRPDGTLFEPTGRKHFGSITGEEAFLLSLPWQVAGNFCVRTTYQRQHPYDNSCRYFGDENTGRLMLLDARHVVLSEGRYYYRMTEASVCHSTGIGHYTRLHAQRVLADELCLRRTKPMLRQAYEGFCWHNIVGAYMRYYKERGKMDTAMRHEVLSIIKQAHSQMDFSLVPPRMRCKFGFIPFQDSWSLFRIQEEAYFFLRTIAGRMQTDDTGDSEKRQ